MKAGPGGLVGGGKERKYKSKDRCLQGRYGLRRRCFLLGQLGMAGEAAIGFIYFIMITASLK